MSSTGIEEADDAGELRRREAAGEADELRAWNSHIHESACELGLVQRHRLGGDFEIEPVRDDEPVDHVEVGGRAPVHPDDDPVLDDELRLGVVRPAGCDEPELGERGDELLAMEIAPVTRRETAATHRTGSRTDSRSVRLHAAVEELAHGSEESRKIVPGQHVADIGQADDLGSRV